jgi:ABC-type transport system involved in multi-copper enzyme maturation permease subunit
MQVCVIAKYTLIEAFKRRLILLFMLAVPVCLAAGGYAAGLSMVEKQATLAAFYGVFIRITAVLMLGIYLILTESRALESGNVFVSLGLPLSRTRYLLEKWLAYSALALCLVILATIPFLLTQVSSAVIWAWAASLYCELLIVIAAALLLSLVFSQTLTPLLLFGVFYLFARASGEFLVYSNNIIAGPSAPYELWMAWVLKICTYLVPELDRFAGTEWLFYNAPEIDWLPVLLQTILFVVLLLAVSAERLLRKEF